MEKYQDYRSYSEDDAQGRVAILQHAGDWHSVIGYASQDEIDETGNGAFPVGECSSWAGGDKWYAQPADIDGARANVYYRFSTEEDGAEELGDLPWDDDHLEFVVLIDGLWPEE